MLAMAAGVQYIALLCRGVDPVFCIVQLSPTNICKHLSWECSVNLSTAKWRIDYFQKQMGWYIISSQESNLLKVLSLLEACFDLISGSSLSHENSNHGRENH